MADFMHETIFNFFSCLSESGSHVPQAGLELMIVLLPWDYSVCQHTQPWTKVTWLFEDVFVWVSV